MWICLYIITIYRLIKISILAYLDQVATKADQQIRAAGGPTNIPMASVANSYRSWESDTTYKKLIASIDMFFNKFPEHEWAVLKF